MRQTLETLLCLILLMLPAASQPHAVLPNETKDPPSAVCGVDTETRPGPVITVPRNTKIQLVLLDPLSSATAKKGESVRLAVTRDVVVDGIIVLPAGALVFGRVSKAKPAVPHKRDGVLTFRLTSIPVGPGKSLRVSDHLHSISRMDQRSSCLPNKICVAGQPISKKSRGNRKRLAGKVVKAIVTAPVLIPLTIVWFPLMVIATWDEGGPPNGKDMELSICSEQPYYVVSSKVIHVANLQPAAPLIDIAHTPCKLNCAPHTP